MHTISLYTVLGTVLFFFSSSIFLFWCWTEEKKCQQQRHIGNHVFGWCFFLLLLVSLLFKKHFTLFSLSIFFLLIFFGSHSLSPSWKIEELSSLSVVDLNFSINLFRSTVYAHSVVQLTSGQFYVISIVVVVFSSFASLHSSFSRFSFFRFLLLLHFFFLFRAKSYACVQRVKYVDNAIQNGLERSQDFIFGVEWRCWVEIVRVRSKIPLTERRFFGFSTKGWQSGFFFLVTSICHISVTHFRSPQIYHCLENRTIISHQHKYERTTGWMNITQQQQS